MIMYIFEHFKTDRLLFAAVGTATNSKRLNGHTRDLLVVTG